MTVSPFTRPLELKAIEPGPVGRVVPYVLDWLLAVIVRVAGVTVRVPLT